MSKMRLAHFCLRLVLVGLVIFPATVWAGGGGVGVSPASLSFGSLPTNTASQTATVLVTNNSRRSISIQQLSSSAQEFVVISPAMPIVLAPRSTFPHPYPPPTASTLGLPGRRQGYAMSPPAHDRGGRT